MPFDGGDESSFENEPAFEPTQFTGSNIIHTPLSGMVEELQYIATPDASGIMENGRVRNLIMEARARLSDVAKDSTEQMVIDTVAMLFEFILGDTEVPAEVRAQLGRLQFLVLKTALLDPDFFTQAHHPARMLVNRIGSISLGLRSLDPSGERISIEIRQIIETLLADKSEGLALFTRMLDEFDALLRVNCARPMPGSNAPSLLSKARKTTRCCTPVPQACWATRCRPSASTRCSMIFW